MRNRNVLGCVDQISAFKMIVEEYLGKGRKLYSASMDLEKGYDRIDREALCYVLVWEGSYWME